MSTRDAVELRRAVIRLSLQFTILIVVLLALMGTLLYAIVAASTTESTNKTLMDATQVDSPHDAPLGVFVAMSEDGQVMTSPVIPPGLPDTAAIKRVASTQADEQGIFPPEGAAMKS